MIDSLERRFGKTYHRVRRSGRGNLGSRTRAGSTRYDFFFDAKKGGQTTSFAHAWRGKNREEAQKALIRDYAKRGYEIRDLRVVTISDSLK